MPSAHVHEIYTSMAPHLTADQVIVSATKGIVTSGADTVRFQRISEVIAEALGPALTALRGAQRPVVRAGGCRRPAHGDDHRMLRDPALAARLQEALSGPALRLYTNDDVIGVELGGALKNVIAIATGIVEGLGLGHNSAAALITRGIAEITRLAVACGGRRETMAGLAGLGDLVLTCTGESLAQPPRRHRAGKRSPSQ